MGLLNVNDEERDSVAILIMESIELGNLPAEWWSSVASEDEHHRPLTPEIA